MQTTIELDDSLLEMARSLTGLVDTTVLVLQALETLVRLESGKRLVALDGTHARCRKCAAAKGLNAPEKKLRALSRRPHPSSSILAASSSVISPLIWPPFTAALIAACLRTPRASPITIDVSRLGIGRLATRWLTG